MKYHVYSPLLEGYIAMDFNTRHEAVCFIYYYHDKIEARAMRIVEVAV